MYRWCRRRKGGIAAVAALMTVLIIGVSITKDADNRHETGVHRDRRAMNIGRKQLQANIEYFSIQGTVPQRETPSNPGSFAAENERAESRTGNTKVTNERSKLLVYIYELPSMFNADLLHCASNNTDSQAILSNSVIGISSAIDEDYLEVVLHRTLLSSNYVTTDASKADVLYVPFYASLACACGDPVNITDVHDRLWRFLNGALPYFRDGMPSRPHFMALSRHERHYWTKKCPLLRDKIRTKDIIFITPEKEANVELRKYAGRETSSMVVAPYPSRHEPMSNDLEPKRNILTFFPDSTKSPGRGIRTLLRNEITEMYTSSSSESPPDVDTFAVRFTDDTKETTSNMQISCSPTAYSWMRRSVFCLHAPADTEIRASFYDAVAAGCIPVTFLPLKKSRKVAFPFVEKLDYSVFTLNIPPDLILAHEYNVTWYLSTVPKLRITILQQRLKQYNQQLLYSTGVDQSKGAFEMVIEEMLDISS